MQPGDMKETYANIDELSEITGYKPSMPIEKDLKIL